MADFTKHNEVLILLANAQSADEDIREIARECNHFIDDQDGQWDPGIINQMGDRPRFTFDEVSGTVDSIAGDLEETEFAIKITPAGGEATEDIAEIYDGLIRNIQSISDASDVYGAAGRALATVGMDGWRVTTDWAQSDSFDQDFFIVKIANYLDRVWFDVGAEKQDMSDARYCFVLQALTKADYDEKFPDGSGLSVSDGRTREIYQDKADFVIVGEILYKKPKK